MLKCLECKAKEIYKCFTSNLLKKPISPVNFPFISFFVVGAPMAVFFGFSNLKERAYIGIPRISLFAGQLCCSQ